MRVIVALLSAIMLTFSIVAQAEEPTEVSTIVADPDVYHLRSVTVQAIVGRVRMFDPYYLPSGSACYGAYTFTLGDTAGSGALLDVAVLGICGRQAIVYPEVADGDRIWFKRKFKSPAVSECRAAWTAGPSPPQ